MREFNPRLEILTEPQRRLWPLLASVPSMFVLYGGTALALRLGHRRSADFDFFSAEPFVPDALIWQLPFAEGAEIVQKAQNTLCIRTREPDAVLISFFGGLRLAQIELPDRCAGTRVYVASPRDLFATKLNTIFQRAEAKDYLDVFALLESGLTLSEGLAYARAVYGPGFNPMLPLKALTFFADGDLPSLPEHVRRRLLESAVAVNEIPVVVPAFSRISTEDQSQPQQGQPAR